MTGPNGRPEDDDELIVDMETTQDGVPTPGDDDIEEVSHVDPSLRAESLPDEIEERNAREREQDAEHEPAAGADDDSLRTESEAHQRMMDADSVQRRAEAAIIIERAQAAASVANQQRSTAQVGLDTLKLRLDYAYRDLQHAKEAGNAQAEIEIGRGIQEMQNLRSQIEQQVAQLPDPNDILRSAQSRAQAAMSRAPQGQVVGAGMQVLHPLARRWSEANAWTRSSAQANQFVIARSQQLVNHGWDPNSPGFYAQLSKDVRTAFPKLKVADIRGSKTSGAAARGGVAPAGSSTGTRSAPSNVSRGANGKMRYRLTGSDQAAMKRANLDPSNAKHRVAFAKARMESSRSASDR